MGLGFGLGLGFGFWVDLIWAAGIFIMEIVKKCTVLNFFWN